MIETTISIEIYPDQAYNYRVNVAEDELQLEYKETGENPLSSYISFGSLSEMEAVARAMLRAVKNAREMNEEIDAAE